MLFQGPFCMTCRSVEKTTKSLICMYNIHRRMYIYVYIYTSYMCDCKCKLPAATSYCCAESSWVMAESWKKMAPNHRAMTHLLKMAHLRRTSNALTISPIFINLHLPMNTCTFVDDGTSHEIVYEPKRDRHVRGFHPLHLLNKAKPRRCSLWIQSIKCPPKSWSQKDVRIVYTIQRFII